MSFLARSSICGRTSVVPTRVSQRPSLFRVAVRGAADLKTLKTRMATVGTVMKVTKAMKMVAAAKLTGLQRALQPSRDFAEGVSKTWEGTAKTASTNRALVVFTSDRGLCGGLNSSITRRAKALLKENNVASRTSPYGLFAIGLKAIAALEKIHAQDMLGTFSDYNRVPVTFRQTGMVASDLLAANCDEYTVLYNRFKNVMVCTATEEVLYGFKTAVTVRDEIGKYEIESGGYRDVMQNLHEFRFACRLWQMFNENITSEFSQRMNAMTGSAKAAGDMMKSLSLLYNRTRQAKITTELIEIVSGAVAMDQADSK